jgi:two-component system, LuxR family, sensor kinase FixL
VVNLRLMSDVLANALARRQTDDALKASEVMKSAILDSLTSGVAVIDAKGHILGLNGNWVHLVAQSDVMNHRHVHVGDNLLAASSADAVAGIRTVLDGSQARFGFEWVSSTAAGTRWWMFVTTRLSRAEGGAVVTLVEITEQRRAEIEAQRGRQVLAHVGRVSTMGELTASLAHQLNQPLTGIMSNAQAARRLLERPPADYAEVRSAMSELLRRGEFEMVPVDLNAVIRDVVGLVNSDAVIRNVVVTLELDPQPIVVRGDRVQLQQVVLNLIVNALEAIPDGDHERAVCVSCQRTELHEVRVMVRDTGIGLGRDAEGRVFDPFYTTKPNGMGMGLSIARSIVESHGGAIHARNDQKRGTVIEFSLPLAELAELV